MQFLEEQQRIRSSLLIERDTIKKELRNYPEGKLMLRNDVMNESASSRVVKVMMSMLPCDWA